MVISVNAVTYKIVRAVITDLKYGIGHNVGQNHKFVVKINVFVDFPGATDTYQAAQ